MWAWPKTYYLNCPFKIPAYVTAHACMLRINNQYIHYRRSGNFRVKKLSYDKFLCKKIFVGMTPFRISINSAR